MKKTIKKLFMVAVIAFTAFSAFAQTSTYTVPSSQTADTTQNLFYTDVDKFMNVNEWSTLNPENAFIMFDTDGTSYDLGFAKNFSNFYWGSYFHGDFGTYNKKVTKTESNKSYEEHNGQTDQTSFYFTNLFGFGNIGFRAGFYYSSGTDSNKSDDGTNVTASDKNSWALFTRTGWQNATIGSLEVKPYIIANFLFNNNGGTQTTTASKVTGDTRNWRLDLGAGGSTVLAKDDLKVSTLSAELLMQFTNPVDKDYSKDTNSYFELPVSYRIVFNPTEQFSFGFRARIDNTLNIAKADATKTTTTTYKLTPSAYAGLQYDTLKKVVLNAGVKFTAPQFSVTESKNKNTKTTETTYNWNGTDGSISFTSGLQINPVKNLCIDCSWNILGDLIGNNLTTTFGEGTVYSIWENINLLLVHNIKFQISYKF